MRVRKTKPSQPFAIPQGAAIFGTVTETLTHGQRALLVHGEGGPGTSIRVKRGAFEIGLPATTIVGVHPGPIHVAWDGIGYKLCHSLREIQADDKLTFIGSVEGVPRQSPPTAATALGRPPLHPIACEQIDQLLHRVDQNHWPFITKMRGKTFYPPDEPVPPRTPQQLLSTIHWYASMLFKAEADQYEQFRSDERYPAWLSGLADRVIARVRNALDTLEEGESKTLLMGYHGLSMIEVDLHLRQFLLEIRTQYEQGNAPGQHPTAAIAPTSTQPEAASSAPSVPVQSRQALRDAYLAAHPTVKKLDICWAAGQHYSEWKRWLRGALRDGSLPDRAFRALLESGKAPNEFKNRPRPDGWK